MTKSPSWFDEKTTPLQSFTFEKLLDYALKVAKESYKGSYKVELEEFEDCVETCIGGKYVNEVLKDENFFETYAGVEHNDLKNKLYEWLFDLKTVKETRLMFMS